METPYKTEDHKRSLFSYFNRHKTMANLLLVVMVALGIFATSNIRSQFFPDVVIESVNVSVAWPGAGAEDVDKAIIELLSATLLGIEGVEGSSSSAREGSGRVNITFEPGWDMARALEDVKAAVESVRTLPDTAETPKVSRGAWRDRVTDVVITGPVSLDQLGRFADEYSAMMYREGVTRTIVRGISAPMIRITVADSTLVRNELQLREIAAVIGTQITTNPAGDVAGGSARIRTGAEKRSAEEIASIVVRTNSDGSKLTVRDVAQIEFEGVDSGRAYFKGSDPAVLISVDRSFLGDAIEIQDTVARLAEDLQLTLPSGTTIELINTRAELITDRLNILLENGLMGLGLVLMLLYLFLGARTAFWVAAGIPVAMFAAIAVMYFAGLTINMMSLFALIITLGIVVDDAIVVGEHADFRTRRLGESPMLAAENAAHRMAAPVFSSTITTILAFFGLVFIGGRFGSLIADIPFTVIAVLLASLVECFLILPNHMRHALTSTMKKHWYDVPSRVFNAGFRRFRDVIIVRLIRVVIRLRYPVVAGAVLLLTFSSTLFISGDVTWRFFSSPEQGSISGNIAMLPGATRSDTLEMIHELQRAVQTVSDNFEQEYGTAPVTHAIAQVGGTAGRGLYGQGTKDPDQLGAIDVGLIDANLRAYSSFTFLGAVQQEVRHLPLLETLSFRGGRFGPGGDSLDVSLYGADSKTLKSAAEYLKTQLSQYPEISALEDNLAYDKNELNLQLTPRGEALGFTLDGLGGELRDRLNGITAATFPDGLRSGSIVVQLSEQDLTADFMQHTYMRTASGTYVPLSDIVFVETSLGFSTVLRENGVRLIKVSGSISEDDTEAANQISEALQSNILPEIASQYGVQWDFGGLAQQESDFISDALVSFTLCMLGIYLVLSWIFASWTRPVVVMAIIPFGLIGTLWGHYFFDVPLSMFTIVGLIGMSGIIINDSIVLVTTIQDFAKTRGLIPAIVEATADRLRPLVLTTLTTVLGLTPLLFETSQQAQFLKPTVITLVFGLSFGFVVVLLVVPSLVAIQQDFSRIRQSLRRALTGRLLPRPLRISFILITFSVASLVVSTVGYWVLTDTLIAPLQAIVEVLTLPPSAMVALGAALFGTIAILFLSLLVLVAVALKLSLKMPNGESIK